MSRRRRRRTSPFREYLAKSALAYLLDLPAVEVADAPRLRLPLPRLADVGLPSDRDWRRETRNAIAPPPSSDK